MSKDITIGLIPSPDMPQKMVSKIIDHLGSEMAHHVDDKVNWQFSQYVASIIGTAEHVDKAIDIAIDIRKSEHWDFAICITDLPSISSTKTVICDINKASQTAMLSLPALGVMNLKNKLRDLITGIVSYIYHDQDELPHLIKKHHKLSRVTEVQPKGDDENEDETTRLIVKSTILGWLHLITGMTLANEPWTAIFDFKKIISVSFATGTYISIFSTPWDLSLHYDYWRFILLTLLSIFGMVGWLIYAYHLWEPPNPRTQRLYRYVYNFTTVTTLTIITFLNYLALFVLLTFSILLFVPASLFAGWTSLELNNPTAGDYFHLIWFVTSLGILAGAMGSAVESADKIKRVTYSYRQYFRYETLEQQQEKEEESQHEAEDDEESYEGNKQSHDKEEEDE
ncbi:hypothetical protein [Staphylococcus auricularis]|uniref:hypothetical protein n=1 Tax=Staphylococcus auricularis TaxID=29379 RepID=UPI000D1BC6C2|nr:hypothetical protein [Staphylococcus auricularis]MCE5038784.1 hypothetical protein [Staphylococcus auricularis]MEB6570585.1 hypothetical protein [Staphylococcus auricularis]PTH27040.1 hypothetical protein BU608_02590 [Staphylococcus auricularis]